MSAMRIRDRNGRGFGSGRFRRARFRRALFAGVIAVALPVGVSPASAAVAQQAPEESKAPGVIPQPVEMSPTGSSYAITADTEIYTQPGSEKAAHVGRYLAGILRPSTGYPLRVREARGHGAPHGIFLLLHGSGARIGQQGYRLNVTQRAVIIRAGTPSGLFHGVQTLRQLLPAEIEADSTQSGPWTIHGTHIVDHPRFGYRGAMLDVARHFFTVDQVKRYIGEISMYKINYLHLHLSDDQGWRIALDSWPKLTEIGGSTEVGGGPGGYYTQAEYKEIVDYAQAHFVTIVPEIDTPSHTNAALASYGKLNCDGTPTDLYTGTHVGFSSLCVHKDITYDFLDDVAREIDAMTPGPYIHIGGDEAHSTTEEDYQYFMDHLLPIVSKYGKRAIAWHGGSGIANVDPPESTVIQFWGLDGDAPAVKAAAEDGNKIILSPAGKTYIDQKYNEDTELGLHWTGYTPVKDSYTWEPGTYLNGVSESAILGIEAPLWSETLETIDNIEFMAFPRLPGIAELAWSPASATRWKDYRERLAAQGQRWEVLGIDYYRSPQVPWEGAS